MYNYYQQQPGTNTPLPPRANMLPPQQFGGLRGHPVSSLEEVKASSIDFDGSIFYFPDIANKKIYTKTVGLDGVALLNMYELKPLPSEPVVGDFVTREEFESALTRISEILAGKFPSNNQPVQEPATPPQNYKEVF